MLISPLTSFPVILYRVLSQVSDVIAYVRRAEDEKLSEAERNEIALEALEALQVVDLPVVGLAKARPFVDVVAMDIKLPHATGEVHWDTHREFLKWLVGRRAFVKIVVDSQTPLEEIETAVNLVAEIDRRTPLVLQPESATYLGGAKGQDARRGLLRLLDQGQRIALECLDDVRVIPQCHRIIRIR